RPPAPRRARQRCPSRPLPDLRSALRDHEQSARLPHGELLRWAPGTMRPRRQAGQSATQAEGDRAMKRMHVHVAVENLDTAIGFYSTLFAAAPTVIKPDYAKWMLDDPRVNFAISMRGARTGLNHLGIQVESESELDEVYGRLNKAGAPVLEEGKTTCCY